MYAKVDRIIAKKMQTISITLQRLINDNTFCNKMIEK